MRRRTATILGLTILFYFLICAPAWTLAARGGLYQLAEGVAIYVKLIPSKALQGQPETPADNRMHGGVPPGDHVYHVIVDLFDEHTGKRITNAEIAAQILERDATGPLKRLEAMQLEERLAYANYFDLPGAGPYQVRLTIRRPGASRPIRAELTFEHTRR